MKLLRPKSKRAVPLVSARTKAVDLLSRREHSQFELRQKLLARGYDSIEVDEALVWLQAHGFQSDLRFKASLFRRRCSNYGDMAIEYELGQHGLAADLPEPEISDVLPEEERAFAWLTRRYSSRLLALSQSSETTQAVIHLKAKAFQALRTRGFEFSHIEKAWRRMLNEQADAA